MYLKSLKGCRLIIGSYPPFNYDARGGGGKATLHATQDEDIKYVKFASETFSIPPLTWKTTKLLCLPLPPGLKLKMCMDKLEGMINQESGEIKLKLDSRFIFSIFSILKFPNLIVKTSLETGKVKGTLHEVEGLILQRDGKATLVGVAMIPVTGNKALDFFLGLPNEALAILQCEIKKESAN